MAGPSSGISVAADRRAVDVLVRRAWWEVDLRGNLAEEEVVEEEGAADEAAMERRGIVGF